MTTTRSTANCIDCGRKLTSKNRDTTNRDLCGPCSDYAAWENQHDDDGHDELGPQAGCPVCEGNAPTAPAAKAGHTNTKPATWTSHKGHDHPATAKARAACRKAAKA